MNSDFDFFFLFTDKLADDSEEEPVKLDPFHKRYLSLQMEFLHLV